MESQKIADTLKSISTGIDSTEKQMLSTDQKSYFCEHYTDFCRMLEIIEQSTSNKITHLIIHIADAIVKGVAAGICEE
jgi:hypothetical protein